MAAAIAGLIEHPAPPLRAPVGADARVILGLQKLLPEKLMLRLWSRLAG